jgi:polyhydroxyalkanoate synthesis regulator protein
MFERAMKMFTPFAMPGAGQSPSHEETPKPANGAAKQSEEINELKSELEEMRKQLSELAQNRK